MDLTPDVLLGQTDKAYLQIEFPKPPANEDRIYVRFNPTEYQVQKQNTFAEIGIPGLETPPIQFIRGASEKLTTELLVDTTHNLKDVRKEYVARIQKLMKVAGEAHAPPIVTLVWGGPVFTGVIEGLSVTYTLFTSTGVPLRAKLGVTMRQYRRSGEELRETPRASPDFDKLHTVRRGDSLPDLAVRVYADATRWREIARANGIRDPRRLVPGTVLRLPRLPNSG
jgi:nucleoid-associated protein YgaU